MDGPLRTSLSPMGPPRPWYPTSFTPARLPNLVQWFDADQAGGVDGQPLAQLTDLSQNGKHATQATTSKQPLWIADAFGGHAAVRADGVDDFYTLSGLSVSSGADKTIVVCLNAPLSANNQRYLFDAAGGRLAIYLSNDASHLMGYLDGSTARNGNAHTAGWQVLTFSLTSGVQGEIRRNSSVVSMPAVGARAISGACTLFSHNAGASLFVDCDLGGWIICSSVLSATNRASAEVYYKLKYGIA